MAIKIGGDIRSNLEMIQKHVTELQNIEKERKSSLAPYTYTIYISFAVFLGIAVILSSQFFSEFEKVQEMMTRILQGHLQEEVHSQQFQIWI